jgi:hypothetical protein
MRTKIVAGIGVHALAALLAGAARAQDQTPPAAAEPPVIQVTPWPDRWRIPFPDYQRYPGREGEYPYSERSLLDPFDLNVLKGDEPIVGSNTFLALTLTSETLYEYRTLPTPNGVSASRGGSEEFFGDPDQSVFSQTAIATVEVFHGETSFKPKDWAVRFTPVFNYNQLNTNERGVVNIDPREGTDRRDSFFGLQEGFAELRLATVSPQYDFVSVRGGVQQFTSDFRGFVFSDNEPGVRFFGTLDSNRDQWNAVWFSNVEKDTNSGLNDISNGRGQNVFIANYYHEDFIWPGYTGQVSVHWNVDHGGVEYDDNGFLTRPSNIGSVNEHSVNAAYLGWEGDGHIGSVNVTHALIEVLGHDTDNPLAGRGTDINAQMAALEVSMDHDWIRPKLSVFYASGDSDPTDGEATAFCPILDSPNFAGGANSFWNRQGIKLTQTGVNLVDRFSLVPALRASKLQDQANFVNPGILLFNAGATAKVTPKLTADVNLNWSRFMQTEPLQLVLNQNDVHTEIGWDLSLGIEYRPFLSDNVIVQAGTAAFLPGQGFRDVLTPSVLYQGFVALILTY